MSQWVLKAMQLIYKGAASPDIDSDDYETLGASDEICMVTTLMTQWLVRFMCKKLLQLMTPEALILKRKYVKGVIIMKHTYILCYRSIPLSYLETYLNFQNHFSIKELITEKFQMLHKWYANKKKNFAHVNNCLILAME